jgi:hypothetical protein
VTENRSASEVIAAEATSWPGVEAAWGERGELSFRVGRREIGHLHGDPVFPGRPGFGARRLESEEDVADVIALMRLNYERVVERHGVPA